MADKLAAAKPHVRDAHAAAAQFWAGYFLDKGQDLTDLADWPEAAVKRFVNAVQTRIAALRKARDYDSSDGLAVWMHSARALTAPRIAPPVREIWQLLLTVGPNAAGMGQDLLQEAGLPPSMLAAPKGFEPQD